MTRQLLTIFTVSSVLSLAIVFGLSPIKAQGSPTITATPSQSSINVGQQVDLDLNISAASDVGGYEVTLNFDPSVLQADSNTMGGFLASTGNTVAPVESIDNTGGSITVGGFSFGSNAGPSGSGLLNTITFTAVGNGSSNFSITKSDVTGKTSGSTVTATTNVTNVTVGSTLTPTPTTITPSPSPTGDPRVSQLTLMFRLQGITTQVAAQNIDFSIRNAGTTTEIDSTSLNLTPAADGMYTATLSDLPVGTVKVCVKGQSHLRRCYDNLNLAEGGNTIDRSQISADLLLIGDVNSDNLVSIDDIASINTLYTNFSNDVPNFPPQDVNHDARITIDDLALAVMNYSNFELPGDE